MKEFTKADLKYGYLVVMRSGDKAIYMPSIDGDAFDIDEYGDCLLLKNYNNELAHIRSKNYDIVKVFGLANAYETTSFDLKRRSLIWERTETKHMTVEEMRQKLEELLEERIEVEPSRNDMLVACYEYCESRVNSCIGCCFNDGQSCKFYTYSDESLKQCYEKVIADGR